MTTTDLRIDHNKFKASGEAIPYYGNTIISLMNNKDWPIYNLSKKMMELIRCSALKEKVRILPLASIHMTVIPLIREIDRAKAIWPDGLPKTAKFSEIDNLLVNKIEQVEPYHNIAMNIDEVQITGFRLSPQNNEMERELRTYRDAIAKVTDIVHPDHDQYHFHVSLAYIIKPFSKYDIILLDALEKRMTDLARKSLNSFKIAQPQFTVFNNMLAYSSDLSERGNLY